MSRRKQAKPRALKHEGEEEVDADGVVTTIQPNSVTLKSTVDDDVKGDDSMMLEDITDDDDEVGVDEEQDMKDSDTSEDEPELEVKVNVNDGNVSRCKEVKSVCEQEVNRLEGRRPSVSAVVAIPDGVEQDELMTKSHVKRDRSRNRYPVTEEHKADETSESKQPFDDASVHSGDSVGRPAVTEDVEENDDIVDEGANNDVEDDEDVDDEVDDDDDDVDDESLGDDDDEEAEGRHLDGEDQDVDDEFTSDSFCSELYSSHTSSSFSPSISDGMTTPNSITNEPNDGSNAAALEAAGEKPYRNHHHSHHHVHPRAHHLHHRRAAGMGGAHSSSTGKEKGSSKHHHHNNNSSSHNHNTNNNGKGGLGAGGSSGSSTYHCQFCEKTFPRLGYLKKHEQSHTEHMPFKCEYCARLFKHKRSRDRHTKLHTGDRRYRCLHCEAAFSRSDHLKIHMKTHDNQKPFQCTICNRGYNTAAALTSHMQNHKKQLALTGSPNLTYSPRSTTSSLSSGGGSGGSKRGSKFSPYANDPLLLMSRGGSKLSSSLAKGGAGTGSSNRTPTPGSTGGAAAAAAAGGGPPASGNTSHQDLLSCPYCTRTDFVTLEQLGLHVQSMHGGHGGPLGLLGSDTSTMPSYFTPGGRRAVTPDGNALSLGGLSPYPPIGCEFCTMKFPTVPLMFAHLKAAHLDRLAGHQRSSPSNGSAAAGSPLGSRPPSSGFHPLDQLHFNKSLLGSAFPSFYGGLGGAAGMSGGSIKAEQGANGRDENGNEEARKRKRRGDKDEDVKERESMTKRDEKDEAANREEEDNEEDQHDRRGASPNEPNGGTLIKQERKEELEHPPASPSISARSSPCDSLESGGLMRPGSRDSPAEQLTPTDLSQPKMKRLKLETPEDEEAGESDRNKRSNRSQAAREPQHKQNHRRDGEKKDSHHLSALQHGPLMVHSSNNAATMQHSQTMGAPASTAHQPPGAYLCNQCNAALPDFESFRTHLKAHLEQSAASAAAAAAMRLSGEQHGGSNSSSSLSLTTFLCQQCGATLSCQAEYEQHTIGHYLVMAVEYRCQAAAAAGSSTGSASCNGKGTFSKVEDLHKHLYEGHMQLLYKCTVCGESFESKVQVQVHFAVSHSVEVKLYRCSACAEVFRTERDFRQHIRSRHLTAGAVQCMFCRMVCSSELEMHFHLASHARKFKCPACPESFHVEFLLDRHIQTQHSQKETASPNRRESSVTQSTPSSTSTNPSQPTASTATTTAVSTAPTSTVTGLDYLHLHGQMAAMAAAAAWPSLYQTANKFYNNPLQVDTLNQLKHPQHLLHGFYDTMLGKAQQQQRGSFLSETSSGGKKNPFAGHSPNASATNALLGLGYGGTVTSANPSQQQRTGGSHPLNGTVSSGMYSPEENGGSSVPTNSSKLYSPIAMIQRYGGDGGMVHSSTTAATSGGPSRAESPSPGGQLLLAATHPTLALPDHLPEQPTNRKPSQPPAPKNSGTITPQQMVTAPPGSNSCYSCGICERSDFSTESEVQTHRKIVHNLKTGVSLRCAYCNGDFRSRNELENHMKVAHNTGGGKHKCLICDEIFPSPAVLAEHKLTHCKVGASGRCSHCSLPLPDAHTFKQHLPAHQQAIGGGASSGGTGGTSANGSSGGSGSAASSQTASSSNGGNSTGSGASSNANAEQDRFPQQCICCRQTLNSEFEISLHAKFHTKSPDTNERTCALCLEPLPSQPESNTKICDPCLKRHNFPTKLLSMNFLKPAGTSLVATPNLTGPPSTGAIPPSTHLPQEGRSSTSLPTHLQQEQQPTSGREAFQCNLCKKPLPSSQKLQEHLIDHTFAGCEERGYVCYLCSAVFTSSAGLQAHLPLAHSNAAAKPYDCERCGVAYFFRAELEHHLIDHELGKTSRTFEHTEDWHTAHRSPVSDDDEGTGSRADHIKQELCEPEQEQDGSSPFPPKDEQSENEYQSDGNEKEGKGNVVQEEAEEEGEDQTHTEDGNEHTVLQEDVRDDAAVDADESIQAGDEDDELDDEEHEEPHEQEDDEEYIEVEHTTMDEGAKSKATDERLRRTASSMLINGGKDCSALTASNANPTLPIVTAAE